MDYIVILNALPACQIIFFIVAGRPYAIENTQTSLKQDYFVILTATAFAIPPAGGQAGEKLHGFAIPFSFSFKIAAIGLLRDPYCARFCN